MINAGTIGIVANPAAGTDVRRLLAGARTTTRAEKVSIVHRVAVGAAEGGARGLLFLAGPHGIVEEALGSAPAGLQAEPLDVVVRLDASDTTAAAVVLRDAGCGAAVVLGGDGTCRAFVAGWADAPLVAVSTGTNNVFPMMVEATVAGLAAGLVASGAVDLAGVSRRQKTVRIEIEGEEPDLALVDALLLSDVFVGTGVVTEPGRWQTAVMVRAEPASVGVASVGGRIEPVAADRDAALVVEFEPSETARFTVRAPVAPGAFADVGVRTHRLVGFGEPVEFRGPGVLALDGERCRPLAAGQRATLRVARDGPLLIDPAAAAAGTHNAVSETRHAC